MPKDNKEKKQRHFWKDFKAELKKVIWPTPKQIVNNTIAVITIVIIVAVIVFVLDFVFGKMNSLINGGIQKIVESTNSIETTNAIEETNVIESEDIDVEVEPTPVDEETAE